MPVEGLKRRQLLAVLVAARGNEVSADRLEEALWEGGSPDSARASLQSHVSRLRRALLPDQVVRAGGVGYALDMGIIELDSARFEDLAHAATGPERIPSLERALGLWRGGAFGEFAELPGVRGEALRLEELRLTVTEQLIDARMEAGEDARMVAELEALVADHPLREQFWRQLMLALYRSGRQAEALRRCADLRSMLRDEMGLTVSPAARDLEARILADDPSLHHHVEQRVQATPVPLARREPTQLIGRADDIETLREELDRHPIVTVVGPGGVGKTRLAMTVADACASAFAQVVVVELASLRDPDATVQLLASTLDVEQRQHLTLERSIEEFIHDQAVLLVLDNCEHVLGPSFPWCSASAVAACDSPCWRPVGRRWVCPASSSTCSRPWAYQRPVRESTRFGPPPRCGSSLTEPPRHGRASSSTSATWRRRRRSVGSSTGCHWPSSWRPRGCARSAPKPWRTASISDSPCSPGSRRASTRGTTASTGSLHGRTSCFLLPTKKHSPTWRLSPAASISKPPKSCADRRPTASTARHVS